MVTSSKSKLAASSKAVDPTLAALFAESAKPVPVPPKSRYAEAQQPKAAKKKVESEEDEDEEEGDDEELSALDSDEDLSNADLDDLEDGSDGSGDEESDEGSDEEEESGGNDEEEEEEEEASSEDEQVAAAEVLEAVVVNGEPNDRKRKRKNRDDLDDLEAKYLSTLADDEPEPSLKRQKADKDAEAEKSSGEEDEADDAASITSASPPPQHDSITTDPAAAELDKANRTIFLSNVASAAITSRSAKKTLLAHLSTVLDKKASPPQTIESIRFRSTAFSAAGIPKRAAYIKKEVMDATTRSTNAYVVFSDAACVRAAVKELNGTTVLDRHVRVDSVAHPAPVAHRRCVFVGNLGFVDDETVLNTKVTPDGKQTTEKKKRTKAPMDVEEGLWRVFGEKAGKVESVRVVRDAATRVGKGFAYVQFYDENAVESALLLDGKAFPPMLPRPLRVSRCKAPHKTARAQEAKQAKFNFNSRPSKSGARAGDYVPKPTPETQTLSGRAQKLLGKSVAAKVAHEARLKEKKGRTRERREKGGGSGGGERATGANDTAVGVKGAMDKFKSPEDIVFEGRRASSKDGKPRDLKLKGQRGKKSDPRKKRRSAKDSRGGQRAAKWRASGKGGK
ncbi:Nucleolar protein 12 [Coniochaeta hoffmannii]|uniref:Nucleolar protein 12 n=1 Tax=Coniochaeta hoffmannii TaxID=91930 RepID=A0AA38VIJ3_9PEZI|nr:Nucleolar protein 12 [Coniochaeta hoffmannii]